MQNQSNTEQFLKLPYDLLAATSFVSSATGEIVEITMQQKVIYCWMKQRCEFFTRENKEYFDTLDSVANELSIDRKTVMRAITFFTKHGVLFAEKRKATATRQKWFFKRFNNLMLIQADKATQKPSVSPQVKRSEETDRHVPQQSERPLYVELENAGECWAKEQIPTPEYENYEAFEDDRYMDSYDYDPNKLADSKEDDVDEPSFMKVKAMMRDIPKTARNAFTPLPDKLFDRLGNELSDKAYDWVEDNGFYIENVKRFVAELLHNETNTVYLIKNNELINMGVKQAEVEEDNSELPF